MTENNSTTKANTDATDGIAMIRDYLNWGWANKLRIALIMAISLVIASGYIYLTPSTYKRTASLLIKSDGSTGNQGMTELAAFNDLDLFNVSMNVNNEIEVFRSSILMEQVVKRLNLDINYQVRQRFRKIELYTQSPIEVKFLDKHNYEQISFNIDKTSNNSVQLSNLVINDIELDFKVTAILNDTIETPFGKIIVLPRINYDADFDKTITVIKSVPLAVTEKLLARLSVVLAAKQTSIINLSFTDNSIARADDLLNTLISVYNEEWIRTMNESTINTSKFINERLIFIEEELSMVDTDIEQFKSRNRLMDIQIDATNISQAFSEYSNKAFELQSQLSIAQFIKDLLKHQDKEETLLPSNSGLNNDNVESQIEEYNTMFLQKQRLLSNSGQSNPLISDMNNSLQQMRQAITSSINNLISTLMLQVDKIEQQEDQIIGRMVSNPAKAKQLLSIERQQKVKEALYLYLLQKREENELSSAIVVKNTRMVNHAGGSKYPIAPKKNIIFLAALMIGFIIPFFYVWLKDTLNTTVRNKHDLDQQLTMPFLGQIPLMGKYKRKNILRQLPSDYKIVVEERSNNAINEAFRIVRTNIDFMHKSSDAKVLMLTSMGPGSGKTFIAMNLAMSMAIKGEKVLIVDLDMRKASLSNYIGSNKEGVANYLGGFTDDLNQIMKTGALHPNLDIIPVGTIPPNPTELLLGERIEVLINTFRERYTYIFLDCPPAILVADTTIINNYVDATLFVARVGLLDRRMLPEVEQLYQGKVYNNMSIILNATTENSRYGYAYGYGGGYYAHNK